MVSISALSRQNDVATNLRQEIIDPLRSFCTRSVDSPAIVKGALLPGVSISDLVQKAYEDYLLGVATLSTLPDRPTFVFNTTNLATGVSFRISKPYAADYRIGMIENPLFRVALAVTASSAFPPVLSPVIVTVAPVVFKETEGADLFSKKEYRERLILTDGGAYDNLGLETVWKFQTVLVSDAGAPFGLVSGPATDWLGQTRRVLDIAVNQSRALRKRWLIDRLKTPQQDGAYWGIMSEIEGYQLPSALAVPRETSARRAVVRNSLVAETPAGAPPYGQIPIARRGSARASCLRSLLYLSSACNRRRPWRTRDEQPPFAPEGRRPHRHRNDQVEPAEDPRPGHRLALLQRAEERS